jgi:hypothetical protein
VFFSLAFGSDDGSNRGSRGIDNNGNLYSSGHKETLQTKRRLTSGLRDAKRLRLPFSSSFLDSALR